MPRLAETPEDLLSQSEALSLSGLEFMQKILDGTNPGPPIGGTMSTGHGEPVQCVPASSVMCSK